MTTSPDRSGINEMSLDSQLLASAVAVARARSTSSSPPRATHLLLLPATPQGQQSSRPLSANGVVSPPHFSATTTPPVVTAPSPAAAFKQSFSLPSPQHQQQQHQQQRASAIAAAAAASSASIAFNTSIEVEELRIRLHHERGRAVAAEEALIRRDSELDRMKEELDRVQREALRATTNAASLEAELTGVRMQLTDALSSRDSMQRQFRDLQHSHRQLESSREVAMMQVATLTTELEMTRRSHHHHNQPPPVAEKIIVQQAPPVSLPTPAQDGMLAPAAAVGAIIAQLANRLDDLQRQQHSHQLQTASGGGSGASAASTHRAPSIGEIQAMQRTVVDEALQRYDERQQHAETAKRATELDAMLGESESIKRLLREQLDLAHSQAAALEAKFGKAASELAAAKKEAGDKKWLLVQRKWLCQLLREYDSCFRQFPAVLPWFRMPQRKCLRVYVWAVIASLRMVRGGAQQGELATFNKFFAVSPAKCSPSVVFRKIHSEIDALSGQQNNNNNNTNNNRGRSSSPLAQLPSNGNALVVHQQQQSMQNSFGNKRQWKTAPATFVGGNSSTPSLAQHHDNNNNNNNNNNNHHNHSSVSTSGNHSARQVRWADTSSTSVGSAAGVNNSTASSSAVTLQNGFEVDEMSQVLSEIYIIDSRLARALRSHHQHGYGM